MTAAQRYQQRKQPLILRGSRPGFHAFVALLLLGCSVSSVDADICFLLYQNADNCLESSLRNNLKDYIGSDAVKVPKVTSWVYFDALNSPSTPGQAQAQQDGLLRHSVPSASTPLESVWTQDGSQLLTDARSSKYEGSLILTFDHSDQKMKVDKELQGEQNSDDPATLWSFVGYAIEHCMRKNAMEIFLVLDGLGEGSIGFGGDENSGQQRRMRKLGNEFETSASVEMVEREDMPPDDPVATDAAPKEETTIASAEIVEEDEWEEDKPPEDTPSINSAKAEPTRISELVVEPPAASVEEPNTSELTELPKVASHQDIVMALSKVLKDLPEGAPKKFSVIGFDGHFMQTFNVVHHYKSLTDYVLGSESLVPEHGWSYGTISETSSAKAMAQQIVKDFVENPQNENGEHSTPKTLSLVDTKDKFPALVKALNDFMGVIAQLLEEGKDLDFFTFLHRARSEAVSFLDDVVVDVGSIVSEFDMLCRPKPESELAKTSKALLEAYNAVFVEREFGPGTMKGTGMIFDLPSLEEYQLNPDYWDGVLGLKDGSMQDIPNYAKFFDAYINAKKPQSSNGEESVCRGDASKGLLDELAEALSSIVEPMPNGIFQLAPPNAQSEPKTDPTGKGTDGEGLFIEPQILSQTDDAMEFVTNLDPAATTVDAIFGLDVTNKLSEAKAAYLNSNAAGRFLRRNLIGLGENQEEDFMVMYGGIAPGAFVITGDFDFTATWDRTFYVLENIDGNTLSSHPIFVEEQEDPAAAKTVEVVFFEPNTQPIKDQMAVPLGTTVKEAEDNYVGSKGYLEFYTEESTGEESFSLYVCMYRQKASGFDPVTGMLATGNVCTNEYNMRTRDAPGLVAPVIPVRGKIDGKEIEEAVGGCMGKVFEWNDSVKLQVKSIKDVDFQKFGGADAIVMELVASSHDFQRRDIHSFVLTPGEGNGSQATPTKMPDRASGELQLNDQNAGFDVAKCKPAIQSSTAEGNVAQNALTSDSTVLAHTQCENNPWWMVDLLDVREISNVLIVNRDDCCQERLDGVLVELLNDADETLASVQHNPGVDGPVGHEWTAQFENESARKVKVSIQGEDGKCDFLNLASVQVYSKECSDKDTCQPGEGCAYGDVALCKPAVQSTTMEAEGGFEAIGLGAFHAVDGTQYLSHTDCEKSPWWEVDLLSERIVTEIVIKNREDCCFERLDGLKVQLMDENYNPTGIFQHDPTKGSIKPMLVVHFDDVATRKVRVSLDHGDGDCGLLNLEEIQVYSECLDDDICKTEDKCLNI